MASCAGHDALSREANRSAVGLAMAGINSGSNWVFESWGQLPLEVRRDISLDQLGIPFSRVD